MEKNGRLRKEYKVSPQSNNFKATFGIVNRKVPSVMYIKLNTWVDYKEEVKYYGENMDLLNSKIKSKIKEELRMSGIFDPMFFYTPEVKKTLNKNSNPFHACFEFTIKKKENLMLDTDEIINRITILINNVIELIESSEIFEFGIKKNDF